MTTPWQEKLLMKLLNRVETPLINDNSMAGEVVDETIK